MATNRVATALAEYERKYSNCKTKKAAFYPEDFKHIMEISKAKDWETKYFLMVMNSAEFGFITGYRAAMRDARKRAKGEK